MNAVEVHQLTYRYGRHVALQELEIVVPEGSIYALLGPNGSGKSTLMQILAGLRRAQSGTVSLLGTDSPELSISHRAQIGYVAAGQALPRSMRLEQLEAYLAPLYPTWDKALASELRERFGLDPRRTIRTLSRGEHMKAALLCALAPRPKLLLMDEPFTGMDALVRDELVRGLLESAGSEGWSVLLCSHDIGELELLADWVGMMKAGQMQLSESMETARERFKWVDVVMTATSPSLEPTVADRWMSFERSGTRASFLVSHSGDGLDAALRTRIPEATRIDVRPASLRELFVALAKRPVRRIESEVAA